jgi:hypothetical protein
VYFKKILWKIEKLLVKFRVLYFNISHRQFEDRFVFLSLLKCYNILQAGKGSSCQVKLKQFLFFIFSSFSISLTISFLITIQVQKRTQPKKSSGKKKENNFSRTCETQFLGFLKFFFSHVMITDWWWSLRKKKIASAELAYVRTMHLKNLTHLEALQ